VEASEIARVLLGELDFYDRLAQGAGTQSALKGLRAQLLEVIELPQESVALDVALQTYDAIRASDDWRLRLANLLKTIEREPGGLKAFEHLVATGISPDRLADSVTAATTCLVVDGHEAKIRTAQRLRITKFRRLCLELADAHRLLRDDDDRILGEWDEPNLGSFLRQYADRLALAEIPINFRNTQAKRIGVLLLSALLIHLKTLTGSQQERPLAVVVNALRQATGLPLIGPDAIRKIAERTIASIGRRTSNRKSEAIGPARPGP
jgi:hypothetical protein